MCKSYWMARKRTTGWHDNDRRLKYVRATHTVRRSGDGRPVENYYFIKYGLLCVPLYTIMVAWRRVAHNIVNRFYAVSGPVICS